MVDKKKEDVADAEDLLRRTLTVLFWLWHGGKVGQSSLEAAERITTHQGQHEAEVSCGGEADLHRHYRRCKKNPGHTHFIPIHDFKIEHLPSGYRHDVILKWIKVNADLTCRLSVRYTSENRPRFHPGRQPLSDYPFYQDRGGDWLRTGTGCVYNVEKYTEKDNRKCECDECTRPGSHTPKKVWGRVEIQTACHVVFDSDEARHTTCEFFYDTSKTSISQCLTLTGLKVKKSNIRGDWSRMTCVSHDIDMIDKLDNIYRHRSDVFVHLHDRLQINRINSPSVPGVSCLTDPTPEPTVIISHPHGCSKMVTVGMWTHRQNMTETHRYKQDDGVEADRLGTRYTYNTPTCRGSSGAPVMRLPEKGKWWWGLDSHIHSEGGQGNVNKSGGRYEYVSFPTTSPNRLVNKS